MKRQVTVSIAGLLLLMACGCSQVAEPDSNSLIQRFIAVNGPTDDVEVMVGTRTGWLTLDPFTFSFELKSPILAAMQEPVKDKGAAGVLAIDVCRILIIGREASLPVWLNEAGFHVNRNGGDFYFASAPLARALREAMEKSGWTRLKEWPSVDVCLAKAGGNGTTGQGRAPESLVDESDDFDYVPKPGNSGSGLVSEREVIEEINRISDRAILDKPLDNGKAQTRLERAMCDDYMGAVGVLLLKRADPNIQDRAGMTALHYAAGSSRALLLLILAGGDVNKRDYNGNTVLHYTGQVLHDPSVMAAKILCASGADVNAKNKHGCTPLMYAAFMGNTALVKWLCEEGAVIGLQDADGKTAIDYAEMRGREDTANFLGGEVSRKHAAATQSSGD